MSPDLTAICSLIFIGWTPNPARSSNGIRTSSVPLKTMPSPETLCSPARVSEPKCRCIQLRNPPNRCTGSTGGKARTTISVAVQSPRTVFVYSSLGKPGEVYLADTSDKLDQAQAITSFNKLFTERELPQGKPYQWKADNGTAVEGMLVYPPGKFEAKHLPMLTLIHGGPADADGNNFRPIGTMGRAGGDQRVAGLSSQLSRFHRIRRKFLMQIVPVLVSRPGKDILEGVDALVKDGIADADHLTIGGYSYGGYMTNWLITQTTRFKAAVTGAGAVEHVGNWGNDDTTLTTPISSADVPGRRNSAITMKRPSSRWKSQNAHPHGGRAEDIRVAVLEDYLLEHALYSLGIPNKLLVFPAKAMD